MGRGGTELEGGGKLFTRTITDELRIEPIAGQDELFLLNFQPGAAPASDFDPHPGTYIIEAATKAHLERVKDPVERYLDRGAKKPLELYQLFSDEGMRLLEDISFERWYSEQGDGIERMTEDLPGAIDEGRFDPERVIRLDYYDHSFWRPGGKTPISRPEEIEIWGFHFNLDQAKASLEKHPWVLSTEVRDNIVQNWDISGRQSLHATIKLPQGDYDKLVEMWSSIRPETQTNSVPLRDLLVFSAREIEGGYSGYAEHLRKIGLFDPLGIADAAKSESEELDFGHPGIESSTL